VKAASPRHPDVFGVSGRIVLAATVLLVVWARLHLAGLPLERDEGEYAYTGQLLLHGIPPYKLAYSMKFPGTATAYALLMSIFGESITGVHLALIVVNLFTVAFVFLTARNLSGELSGISGAAAYAVLSLMPHVLGQAAHATHFVVLFAAAGVFLLLRGLDQQAQGLIFTSGCLFGLAFVMKQPGLFFVLFGAVYLFSRDWQTHLKAKTIIKRNLLFCCAAAFPCVLTVVALWIAGVFGTFWFWTIKYAAQYGSQVSLSEGFQIFVVHFAAALGSAWLIWAIAGIGLVATPFNTRLRSRAGFLVTFTFFSALAVCPGLYFRPHYFILLLPALSLLAGGAITAVFEFLGARAPSFRFAPLLILTFGLVWPFWSERDFFFERPMAEDARLVNGTNPFGESIKIGDLLRAQTAPSDTIAVLGSEPEIYFYAQRRSATGYLYTYSLMEPQPYAHEMQEQMIHEIEAAQPKFFVVVVMNKSWLASRGSDQTIFQWAESYCKASYERIGLIEISDEGTDYNPFDKSANVPPTGDRILIYRRKPSG
jgi:Dolichyl-phosphate-mannose-protein mannosyltransferase